MNAAPAPEARLEDRAHLERLAAIRDLCEVAHGEPDHYSAELMVTRGGMIQVLMREALHTCHTDAVSGPVVTCSCGRPVGGAPDLDRAEYIVRRASVALGRPLPLLDAAGAGGGHQGAADRPALPTAASAPSVDALIDAVTEWADR